MAKILLLEPDLVLAETISDYLSSSGHEIDWHADAQSAVNGADVQEPELVIMELQLAGHSGVEFLYEFRSYPEWQSVPVIIYSSLDTAQLENSGIIFGPLSVAGYLQKQSACLDALGKIVTSALSPQKA